MKYTRSESGEVVEVKGCAKCPHVVHEGENGFGVMYCTKPISFTPTNQPKKRKTKLIGRWTGAYHASCPLPSEARNVPAKEVGK